VEQAGWTTLRVRGDDPLIAPLPRLIERVEHYYDIALGPLRRAWSAFKLPVWLGDLELIARRSPRSDAEAATPRDTP